MILFSPADACQFAVRIEENGEVFYRKMAETFNDASVKELFIHLAVEETAHRGTYARLLESVNDFQTQQMFTEEYFAYMQAYVERVIFSPERLQEEMGRINQLSDAFDFAIRSELESILYFEELKKFIKPGDEHLVDQIIAEERKHFLELSVMKKKHKL